MQFALLLFKVIHVQLEENCPLAHSTLYIDDHYLSNEGCDIIVFKEHRQNFFSKFRRIMDQDGLPILAP